MATHVDKVADIFVPALSCADFAAQLQQGDILFFAGNGAISEAIEKETRSPWSHVGYVWLPGDGIEPLFVEAVFKFGVRISRLIPNYIGPYDGDVVLCRRTAGLISPEGQMAILRKAISRVGDGYDWQSEVEQAAHKLIGLLPERATNGELYCSGLVQEASEATDTPIKRVHPDVANSPEDDWCDSTVWPECKLLKGTK